MGVMSLVRTHGRHLKTVNSKGTSRQSIGIAIFLVSVVFNLKLAWLNGQGLSGQSCI